MAHPAEGDAANYARRVFKALFHDEIVNKLEMKTFKGAKHRPEPLSLDAVLSTTAPAARATGTRLETQRLHPLAVYAQQFLDTIAAFWDDSERRATVGAAVVRRVAARLLSACRVSPMHGVALA